MGILALTLFKIGLTRGEDMNRDIENTLHDKRLIDMYRKIASVQ